MNELIYSIRKIVSYYSVIILPVLALLLGSVGCKKDNNGSSGGGTTSASLQLVADNLVSPVLVLEPPDDSNRLFIVDQAGKIWIVKNGTKLSEPFMDIQSKMVSLDASYDERGLLGLAFHPDYKTNHKFYIFYTAPPRSGGPDAGNDWNSLTRISEFQASSDPDKADMGSERTILALDHPQMNHNGGSVAFGPDGFLYVSIGDGGNKDDVGPGHVSDWYAANEGGNAQNIRANLLGKILRIDVNGSPYTIPASNPLNGAGVKREIYAYGFRNPYRFSFDMGGSHALIMGDAGQSLWEEINVVTAGGNYGWNVKEGNVCFSTDNDKQTRANCPSVDSSGVALVNPAITLKNKAHPDGDGITLTVIGGYVYRGTTIPALAGKYIFGSYSSSGQPDGKIYSSNPESSNAYQEISVGLSQYVKGIGQDQSGEIYIATSTMSGVSGTTGKVYRLK